MQMFILGKTTNKPYWVLGVNMKQNYPSLGEKEAFCACCTKGFVGLFSSSQSSIQSITQTFFIEPLVIRIPMLVWNLKSRDGWNSVKISSWPPMLIDTEFTDKQQKWAHRLQAHCSSVLSVFCSPLLHTQEELLGKWHFWENKYIRQIKTSECVFSSVYYCIGYYANRILYISNTVSLFHE